MSPKLHSYKIYIYVLILYIEYRYSERDMYLVKVQVEIKVTSIKRQFGRKFVRGPIRFFAHLKPRGDYQSPIHIITLQEQ